MNEMNKLKDLVEDDIVLGYCHLQAEKYTKSFNNGELTEDEYDELMSDLKRSIFITDAAHDLSVRSKVVSLLDKIVSVARMTK